MTRQFLGSGPWLATLAAGLLPILLLLLGGGCSRDAAQGDTRTFAEHGLSVRTPKGWTGGGAGGTYEFRSADGTARLRIGRLDGAAAVGGLKDAQLLAGTGAVATARSLPPSPTKAGPLPAERARFTANDGRIYDVVAVQTSKGVVLFQASVSAEHASAEGGVESLFAGIRQSIHPM